MTCMLGLVFCYPVVLSLAFKARYVCEHHAAQVRCVVVSSDGLTERGLALWDEVGLEIVPSTSTPHRAKPGPSASHRQDALRG